MKPKRPRDTNQLARFIVDRSVGDVEESDPNKETASAVERGRRRGAKGGAGPARRTGRSFGVFS